MVRTFALSILVCITSLSFQTLDAQQLVWKPSPGHTQIPLWPGAIPDARQAPGPERMEIVSNPKEFVGGKPWITVKNVSQPTLTVYPPKGRNTGVAVMVFPGGGFEELAIDLEGTDVCDWLTGRGIACLLLKYRVPNPRFSPYWGAYPGSPMSLEDAQRAMGLARLHAKEWSINPNKIGVLGFSAGGHLVAAMSVHFAKRVYTPVDTADKESCRPDFSIALYPGHLGFKKRDSYAEPRH